MGTITTLALVFSLTYFSACQGYLFSWFEQIPLLEEDVEGALEKEGTIQTILKTLQSKTDKDTHQKRVHLSFTSGKNCGSGGKSEVIYVPNLEISDPLVLGGNATVSAEVRINKAVESLSQMKVVLTKEGVGEIPCTGNIGSCNYADPCKLAEKIPCPKVIVQQGWNCKCPILAKLLKMPPTTYTLPSIPLPAFLVNGKYDAKVQLFDGSDQEVFCYQLTVDVKEK